MSARKTIPAPPRGEPQKPQRRKARSGDMLVQFTVPLVAAAIAMALHTQLDAPLWSSVLVAMLAAVALALVHTVHVRGTQIADLKAELSRARGHGAAPRPATPESNEMANSRRLAPNAVPPPGRPAPPHPHTRAGDAVSLKPAIHDDAPLEPSTAAEPAPSATGALASGRETPPRGPGAPPRPSFPAMAGWPAPSTGPQAGPPPLPSATNGTSDPGATSTTPMPQPMAPSPSVLSPSFAATEPSRGLPAAQPDARAATLGTDAAAPATQPDMAPYWALRPGVPPALDPSPLAAREGGDADRLATLQPATFAPREPTMQAPDGVDAPELAAMQNLIRQLAAQLNGPKSPLPAEAAPREPVDTTPAQPSPTEAVTTSVAALKATVETMRAAAEIPSRSQVLHGAAPAVATAPAEATAAPALDTAGADRPRLPTHDDGAARDAPPADAPMPSYARLADMSDALGAERVDLLLDPILGLGDRKARHFEVSVRLHTRDGEAIDTTDIAEMAAGSGLVAKLDAAKLTRTARVAERLEARGNTASLFSTLAVESLSDGTFLDTFDDVFAGHSALLSRLVLAFSQQDVRQFSDGHWDAIETMAKRGLRLSLEDVTDLDMDFDSLREHGFEFIKLDADVFLNGLPAPDGRLPAADICRHFAELGLALIVGHIEDEGSLAKILGFGVLFGQGALFGGPRVVAVDAQTPPRNAAA